MAAREERRTNRCIREAVWRGALKEPFCAQDLERIGIPEGTARTFLAKHCLGNPDGNTELFERVERGLYRLRRIPGFWTKSWSGKRSDYTFKVYRLEDPLPSCPGVYVLAHYPGKDWEFIDMGESTNLCQHIHDHAEGLDFSEYGRVFVHVYAMPHDPLTAAWRDVAQDLRDAPSRLGNT